LARFVLTPCKVRVDRFVPVKGAEPLVLDWGQLKALIAPGGFEEIRKLKRLQVGAYCGLVTRAKTAGPTPATWVLLNSDRSGKIDWILKNDPAFEHRVVQSYRVDEAKWDAGVSEYDTPDRTNNGFS
jgi:hypothetical protein